METKQIIQCPETDAISGLEFRHFAGEADYQLMLDLYNACKTFNGYDWTADLDDMKIDEKWRKHYDIKKQLIFVEFDGEPIGNFSYNWAVEDPGDIILHVGITLKEEFFNTAIPQAMLNYQERKLVEMTANETPKGARLFSVWRKMKGEKQIKFFKANGYDHARYFFEMTRPIEKPLGERHQKRGSNNRQSPFSYFRRL